MSSIPEVPLDLVGCQNSMLPLEVVVQLVFLQDAAAPPRSGCSDFGYCPPSVFRMTTCGRFGTHLQVSGGGDRYFRVLVDHSFFLAIFVLRNRCH